MTPTLALDTADFAVQLHALLRDIDPAQWRADLEAALRERVAGFRDSAGRLAQAPAGPADDTTALRASLATTHQVLADALPEPGLTPAAQKAAWKQLRERLALAYTDLSRNLEAWDIHVPSLRPTNYARNVLHVSSAAACILVLELAPTHTILLGMAGFMFTLAWTLESTRRLNPAWNAILMRVLGAVAHPHERHRVNSATWYCTALLVLAVLNVPAASLLGLTALGVGDPLAAIIGRRWGKHRFANGRSVEGFAAFLLGTIVTGTGLLAWVHPELLDTRGLLAVVAAAVTGAVVELVARRVDDNVAIPVAATLAAIGALALVG